jgi:hypothetical protein
VLPAGEKVVVDSHSLDERPKPFLSRGLILRDTRIGMKWESGTLKQGSQCGSEPNECRQQDEKTF